MPNDQIWKWSWLISHGLIGQIINLKTSYWNSFITYKYILMPGQISAKWTLTYAIAPSTQCNIFSVSMACIIGRHYRKAQLINCSLILSEQWTNVFNNLYRARNIGKRLAKEIQLAISCCCAHLFCSNNSTQHIVIKVCEKVSLVNEVQLYFSIHIQIQNENKQRKKIENTSK